MAFNGLFTAVQQAPNSNNLVVFTDTSTGTDTNIIGRQIRTYDASGNIVLPTGNTSGNIDWPLPLGTAISVDLLPKDLALAITVVWISSSPLAPPSTYTATILYGFSGYSDAFIYKLIEDLTARPSLKNDVNWFGGLSRAQTDADNVIRSVNNLSIFNAQENLDDIKYLIDNSEKFF